MTGTDNIARDIQPNVVWPCRRAFAARLHLFRVDDAAQARAWLQAVTARIFDSNEGSRVWLNVSFTYAGLEALQVDPRELVAFPEAFRAGMERRGRLFGDRAADAQRVEPHIALLVLCQVEERLQAELVNAGRAAQSREKYDRAALSRAVAAQLDAVEQGELEPLFDPSSGLSRQRAFDLHHALVETDPGRPASVEYFGFRDGISQPKVQFAVAGQPQLNPQIIIPTDRAPTPLLALGTFLVVRQLEQHVDLFWSAMEEQSKLAGFASANALAEFLVGRRQDGQPLGWSEPEPAPTRRSFSEIEGQIDPPPAFVQGDGDDAPPACPFHSHVRRVNPRLDARSPQLLRRGMSYVDPEDERVGLMFMAFNADLERQFEFIQGNWIQRGNHVGGLSSHTDPIVSAVGHAQGQRPHAPSFVATTPSGRPVALRLPDFVQLHWGEYFFLPARPALARIARVAAEPKLLGAPEPAPAELSLDSALAWINGLRDSRQARAFWNAHVPECGLRIADHVFVRDPEVVRAVLADSRPSHGFSVCEYGRKLRSISGPFVLGLDTDTQDYQREVLGMRVIPTLYEDTAPLQKIARLATLRFLDLRAEINALRGTSDPLRSYALIAFVLSGVWEYQLGLPGPSRGSLLTWAQEITDAVFRTGMPDVKLAAAEQAGKELRGYVLDRVVAARTSEDKVEPTRQALAELGGYDDDTAARQLTGILVGGLTAVAGTFVPGLARVALAAGRGANLVPTLRDVPPSSEAEHWPHYRLLARALEDNQLGGPDYLYRTYRGEQTRHFALASGEPHVPIEPDDTVVAWIGGAARADDGPNHEIRFGAGAHMCPGRETARAIIDGILAGLSECTHLRVCDAKGIEFDVERAKPVAVQVDAAQ